MDKKIEDKFIELLCKYTKKDITLPFAHRGDEIVAMLGFIDNLITSAVEAERSDYAREQLKKFAQVRIDIQKAERERCAKTNDIIDCIIKFDKTENLLNKGRYFEIIQKDLKAIRG